MEQLINFLKIIYNIIFPISSFIYILQLEEYDNKRYLTWLKRFFFKRNFEKRGKCIFTRKAKLIYLLNILLLFTTILLLSLFINPIISITLCIISIPIFVFLSNIVVGVIQRPFENNTLNLAKEKIANNKELIIIVIAGSYGKTTLRLMLYEVLKHVNYTQTVSDNINNSLGIANWILKELKNNTKYLILEVDTYKKGEIANSLKIFTTNISIITNISDQHLVRFKSKENLSSAILEVINYKGINIIPETLKLKITNNIVRFKDNIEFVSLAKLVLKQLKISENIIKISLKNFKLPERRGMLVRINNFYVIDESYNISLKTFQFSLNRARIESKRLNKKLVILTGGIPEAGLDIIKLNKEFGVLLHELKYDTYILNTILSKYIFDKGNKDNLYKVNDLKEFWEIIKKQYSPDEIIILLYPELNDLYY